MNKMHKSEVAIIDYRMGNLYSVSRACDRAGLNPVITSDKSVIFNTKAIILPGVGAFGDAIDNLREMDLITPIKEFVDSGKPVFGICLGMQLLMDESFEFGHHEGLGLIPGKVVRVESPMADSGCLKVPQVGWNRLFRVKSGREDIWADSLLNSLPDGFFMYFVHSFYVKPNDSNIELAITQYGDIKFCSALKYRNIFACQGHPERSGPYGLEIYRNLARSIQN